MVNPFWKKPNPEEEAQERQIEQQERESQLAAATSGSMQKSDLELKWELDSERAALVKWQQDLTLILDEFFHSLRGEIDVGTENAKWEKDPKIAAKCNELCIQTLRTFFIGSLNQHTIMSNYSDDRVKETCRLTVADLRMDLVRNFQKYDLKIKDYGMLIRDFKFILEATLLRAMNQGERAHLDKITKVFEGLAPPREKRKKGMFSRGN